ncbi:MAG: DsbE family thiol:disulfide interchange protein [Hyphomicrobiales bacterium]
MSKVTPESRRPARLPLRLLAKELFLRLFPNPWLILPLAVFLCLAALLRAGIGHNPAVLPSALIGRQVPEFALPGLAGLTQDGRAVDGFGDADLKIGGGTLLNVFASWCVPCREEHPVLMELAKDKSVTLLGLNYKDEAAKALNFLGAFGNPYRKVGVDALGRTGLDFGVYGVPETFAIDATGRIVAKHVGALTMADAQQLIGKASGVR